jgi:periplasmic protein TonB
MFRTLMESQARRNGWPGARWGAASVVTHAVLIAGAVAATATHTRSAGANEPQPLVHYVSTDPQPHRTLRATPEFPPLTAPHSVVIHDFVFHPDCNCDPGAPIPIDSLFASVAGDTTGTGLSTTPTLPTEGVYAATAVDRAVSPLPGNPQPIYPSQLRAAGIEGSVLARFVVDTLGRVEAGSIDVVSSTHNAFTESVRDALRHSRFTPARYGRWNVRQLVEQRFSFALER